tara:strand:+ start:188 stop:424 length:237 start_codon:yes stop_codon:yes gene_type:complete
MCLASLGAAVRIADAVDATIQLLKLMLEDATSIKHKIEIEMPKFSNLNEDNIQSYLNFRKVSDRQTPCEIAIHGYIHY